MTAPASPAAAGLARERTAMAWTRTALALLVNGLLVLVRHQHDFPTPVAAALSTVAFLVALVTLAHAVRRSGVVLREDGEIRPATALVVSLGTAVTLLCVATGVALALAG